MKKLSLSLFASLLALMGTSNVQAQAVPAGETDVTTLEWVNNGQECMKDFNNPEGNTVFGTHDGGANLSYVDISDYSIVKLYGEPNQVGRLFINRSEIGDKGIFYVEINDEGVGTFDCNEVLAKQPLAQYIHLNGVKAQYYNSNLNLSMITVSGDPLQFAEDTFELADDEIEIQDLTWVKEEQGCVNNLGVDTGEPIYGTHDGPSAEGKLSYIDITKYASVKLYGRAGDVVRLFINRAEYPSNFQFHITIGEDGVGTFDLAKVYETQEGAEYVHLNGVKTQGGTAKVNHITVVEKPFEIPEGEIKIQDLTWVDLGQGCVNFLGEDTDAPIYGTHDGPSADGKLSYVDITNFTSVKLYGRIGDVVRLFINRAEYPDTDKNLFQFYVTIGEDGVGTLELADVYKQQGGAEYVHLNGVKTAATWQGSKTGKAKVNHITLTIGTTGINDVVAPVNDNVYYNLQGVKVVSPTKGIYIQNGRKVYIK